MGQTAPTEAQESVMAMQVSVCEEAEEGVEHPGGNLRGTQIFQGMQEMDATLWLSNCPRSCSSQAVCETSDLVNGADKGLQAVFDC